MRNNHDCFQFNSAIQVFLNYGMLDYHRYSFPSFFLFHIMHVYCNNHTLVKLVLRFIHKEKTSELRWESNPQPSQPCYGVWLLYLWATKFLGARWWGVRYLYTSAPMFNSSRLSQRHPRGWHIIVIIILHSDAVMHCVPYVQRWLSMLQKSECLVFKLGSLGFTVSMV